MAPEDPLDTLPSLSGENNLPVSRSASALPADPVVATYDLDSPSPRAGAAETYFSSALDAAARLQSISLADDAEDHHSPLHGTQPAVAQQQGHAPAAPAAGDSLAASVPAAAVASAAGSVDPSASASSLAEQILPPTIAGPLHSQDIPVKVWVKDPEKVESRFGVPFGSFISYLLRTETSLPIFGAGMPTGSKPAAGSAEPASTAGAQGSPTPAAKGSSREGVHVWEVRRRFADFEELHRLLKSNYRGYFLPPLPDRSFLESRFKGDSFLKVRKVDLQAYMCTIANHPELQTSQELRLFLTFPACLSTCQHWQHMVQRSAPADALLGLLRHDSKQQQQHHSAEAAAAASSSGDSAGGVSLGGMMWRMKHSLLDLVQPKPKAELPSDELQLRQAKDWCKELQQHLSTAVAIVQSMISHLTSVADDLNDFARCLSHMARFEEALAQRQGRYTPSGSSATQRAADLQLIGYASMRQQVVDKQFVLRTGAALVFLHDWWVLIPEAVATLEEREEAFDALQLMRDELQEKEQQATAAAGSRDKRAAALVAAVEALQDKVVAAQEQYDVLKERNQTELVRLNLQRAVDFRIALAKFAQVQLQLAQACTSVWSGVVEQLAQDAS